MTVQTAPILQNIPALAERSVLDKKILFSDGVNTSHDWRSLTRGKAVSASYLHDYLQYQAPLTSQTLAQGVNLLPAAPIALPAEAATPQSFLKKVDDALQLNLHKNTWFHLSAGLDSSFLLLRATQLAGSVQCATFKTLGNGAAGELDVVHRIAEHANAELTVFDFTGVDVLQAGREMVQTCNLYPLAHPSTLARFLLDRALVQDKDATHIVSGRGIDECIGGYAWHGDAFSDAAKHHDRVQSTDPAVLQSLLKDSSSACAQNNYDAFFKETGHTLDQRLRYDLSSLHTAWNIVEHALEQGIGFQYVMPFSDASLMGELLALPLEQRKNKHFLRSNFKNIYPEFVLAVPKMGLTFDMQAYLQQYGHAHLMQKMFDDSALCQKYVERPVFEKMLETTLTGEKNYGWQIWGCYLSALAAENAELAI